ncbi:DUF488 family protein [Streptomyces sp. N2-109]|uniref:DUF488 family protein n=1 Tax=Streptomyces gossypii TaxID=2883101 RepID=A0ABT2JL98_9ACTN|nr:DUF488 family protein [Streptomyces gossypii]MCT2588647.1 DUF488 family protein [Streptomyces gossypii]
MSKKKPDVRVRRIYDEAEDADGSRVLVDRVWPRGMAKGEAALDAWIKDAAPSTELRRWYGHEPERFDAFAERYRAELAEPEPQEAVEHLRELAGPSRRLTLLTATRDVDLSHALILADTVRNG